MEVPILKVILNYEGHKHFSLRKVILPVQHES